MRHGAGSFQPTDDDDYKSSKFTRKFKNKRFLTYRLFNVFKCLQIGRLAANFPLQ